VAVTETISTDHAFLALHGHFREIFHKPVGVFGPKNTYFLFDHGFGMKLRP
jgi:hypothetical protein